MLPCGPGQLQHILSFILPTESIPREVRKIEGGQGNRVGALSSACCRLEHNKIASAADTPLSLQCQRVREARSPLWTSCLGLHSASTKKMSEKKTEWCLLPFLMPLTPCWPLTHGIPRQWKYNLDGASTAFLTLPRAAPLARCLLLSCHPEFLGNSISLVKMYWEQSWSETSCILRRWREGFADRCPLSLQTDVSFLKELLCQDAAGQVAGMHCLSWKCCYGSSQQNTWAEDCGTWHSTGSEL